MGPILRITVGLVMALSGSAAIFAAPLPYQAPAKHMGVASCASSVCHGAVRPNEKYDLPLNEYIVWSHRDAHAKAYETLLTKESKAIARKLGLPDAHTAKVCLDCHADNVPKEQRGEEFHLSDGVGCESCHGGAENWIESHTDKDAGYSDNVEKGMYPTADLKERAALCLSCHYGNNDKFTTHKIMGAGHPRLSFELDTFQALQPPHFQVDEDYKKRKPLQPSTKVWAFGQLAAASWQLDMLQGPYIQQNTVFPELALFDCHSCHGNSMHDLNWRRRINTLAIQPGAVPVNDGHLRMAYVVALSVDPAAAKKILSLSQALQKATGQSRGQLAAVSRKLAVVVRQVREAVANASLGASDKSRMLKTLVQMGIKGDYRDYIGAEQAVMAIELIMIEMGSADKNRAQLDALYKLVEKDEAFQPARFSAVLKRLQV